MSEPNREAVKAAARALDIFMLKRHNSPVLEMALERMAADPNFPPSEESWATAQCALTAALPHLLAAKNAEIADLKMNVVAFLAPWAVRYSRDHELEGLHPVHYDLLERCGARMVDFKRAALEVSGGVK